MRQLRVAVIDLVTKGPTRALFACAMNANLASIMPQVVATWCEAEGHQVSLICYTGLEDLTEHLPGRRPGIHRRVHRGRVVRLRVEQPLPFVGSGDRARRTTRALLSRRRREILRDTCSFCIDSVVPYQPFDLDVLKDDLRFLVRTLKRPHVAWHDPNFGVRFDEILDAIEDAASPGSIDFIAESSLSLLSEPHLQRLQRNGFKALLPGVESWYELGNKSKTASRKGIEKVEQVSDHVRLLLKYVPYVQTNFVLGLDCDQGPEPFELTKRFVDLTPGAFPGYSLLSAFGRAAPLNLEFQREGRVLPFPFHFLDNNRAMNVRPKNYSWPEFYDYVISLTRHTFSWHAIARRFTAMRGAIPRVMNVVRAVSSEGFGRIAYYREIRRRLDTDLPLRRYFEQETTELPEFFAAQIRRDLGPFWSCLPPEALRHDPNAYLLAETVRPALALHHERDAYLKPGTAGA
jgi:hypothetical protein